MALVKLAETTGEQRYADLAEYFVRQRGQQPLYFELVVAAVPMRAAATTSRANRTTPTTRPISQSRNKRKPSATPSALPTSTPEPPMWHA